MWGMWFTGDIVIDDINWYEVTLLFMIILIEYDVVIEDDIDNNWYWYEMMLLLLIMSLGWDDVDVERHWDEMMLMLIMTLRWDVENAIVIMYVVYVHGGCCDHDGYPWWGK